MGDADFLESRTFSLESTFAVELDDWFSGMQRYHLSTFPRQLREDIFE